jgi:hypothetical protein
MRKRKPWVFARRRLFGWKVRFDMVIFFCYLNKVCVLGTQAVSLLPFPMQSNLLNLRPITELGQVIQARFAKNFRVCHIESK